MGYLKIDNKCINFIFIIRAVGIQYYYTHTHIRMYLVLFTKYEYKFLIEKKCKLRK